MIIQETVSSPIITSIGATPSKFKIKANAKAFKILSGFYSEPVLAIPRELGANAWDAHVKAGNTKVMFDVHAPNNLEPWFSIRDFGVGLSPEDIDQIYTTYFESTKTNDNDSDGCMGLGSKTPFNYTENFTVTSWFNGVKYVYNCFIDEAGAPNILPITHENSNEHNGIEVKFGVKISDISMFIEKITRAYEPFRFRPNIKGANIKFEPRQYIFEGKGWAMRKTDPNGYRGLRGCRAFMGNYSYPVSYDGIRGYVDNHNSNKLYSLLSDGSFDFFFNIGDLEVAPNKEALQYDADLKTAKAIADRASIAIEELKVLVAKQLAVPKTLWEAMSLYARYNSYNGEYHGVRRIIGDISINYNGELISNSQISIDMINVKTGLTKPVKEYMPVEKLPQHYTLGLIQYRERSDKFKVHNHGHYSVAEDGRFPTFLYTGEDNLKKSRIRYYLKGKAVDGHIPDSFVVIDKSPNFSVMRAHQKFLGIPDSSFICIESLPKPPRVPREARTATTDEINHTDISSVDDRYGVSWSRRAAKFDATETYYYVDFYYTTPTWKTKDVGHTMTSIIRFLKNHKSFPNGVISVYGINKKNQHLLKVGKWINVVDLAEKLAAKKRAELEHNLYLFELNESGELSSFGNVSRIISNSNSFMDHLKNKDTKNMFEGFVELKKIAGNANSDYKVVCNLFGFLAKKHMPLPVDLEHFRKTLNVKYMGIFNMLDVYGAIGVNMANLINFIDEKS